MGYEVSSGSIEKYNGKWRGRLRWREVAEDETRGPWHAVSQVFDVKSREDAPNTPKDKRDMTGSVNAGKELDAWRARVIKRLNAPKPEAADVREGTKDVGEWCAWCVDVLEKGGTVDKSTIRGYRGVLKHIRRAFDGTPVSDLTTSAVKSWEAALIDQGISAVYVRKCHVLLKMCMTDAVDAGLIAGSPFTRRTRPPKVATQMPNALDADAYDTTIRILEGGRMTVAEVAALIVLYAGLRREEVAALRWCDVDLERRLLTVNNAIGIGSGGCYVKPTKTDTPRPVPVRDGLAEVLRARERQQRDEIAAFNAKLNADGKLSMDSALTFSDRLYVCGGIDGGFICPDTLTRSFKVLADTVLPLGNQGKPLNFLSLRHSFCTELVREGCDAITGSQLVGNSPSVFAKFYVGLGDDAKREMMRRMDKAQAERMEKAEENGEVLPLDRTGTDE